MAKGSTGDSVPPGTQEKGSKSAKPGDDKKKPSGGREEAVR